MKTALITGATSGIGLELAKLFARDHYQLVIVARKPEELDKAAQELRAISGHEVITMTSDLSQPQAAQKLYDAIKGQGMEIDVLVNNAGYAEYGQYAEVPLDKELSMIRLNVESVVTLTKLCLQDMVQRNDGKILNLGSTAAFMPGGPLMGGYYATKAFVLSLTQTLAYELRHTHVSVTVLCPGPTKTNFEKKVGKKLRMFRASMSAATVAQAGYNGLMQGKTIVVPGWANKLQVFAVRIAPRWLVRRIIRFVQGEV